MTTAYGLLADAIERQLDAGIGEFDRRAADDLLSEVVSMEQPLIGRHMLGFGPLASLGGVTREAVYDRLERLRNVRQEVVKAHQWPARPSPESVLRAVRSVLLAADAAAGVERFYADAERAARVGAAIAELRGDEQGVAAYRGALIGATKAALTALDHGMTVTPTGNGMLLSASELMRAELVARLRGEVGTTGREVEELVSVTYFLVDVAVEFPGACSYGPLCWDGTLSDIGTSGALRRLAELRRARRTIIDPPGPTRRWPRTADEIGARLGALLLVVVSADATASIYRDYAEASARATAEAAAIHHFQCGGLHGFTADRSGKLAPCDAPGVAAQREGLRLAAKAVAERLQSVTCAPFSTEQDIRGVLLDQLAS